MAFGWLRPRASSSLLDPQVARELLRSWRCGSGADRQMALGSTHVQDAQRGHCGGSWGAGTRERRTRKALEGHSDGGHDRSDHQDGPAHAGRNRGGRAPRPGERCTNDVRGDARVTGRPRTPRCRAAAFASARSRPRHTPHEAGAAATRGTAPGASGYALSASARSPRDSRPRGVSPIAGA